MFLIGGGLRAKNLKASANGSGKLHGSLSSPEPAWVVRKPINANPGLKVNREFNFSCMEVFFIGYVL